MPSGAGKSTNRTSGSIKNKSCEWSAKKEGTGGLAGQPLKLEIAVQSGTGITDGYQTEKADDPEDTEPVAGLRDDAFIANLDLHVLVGERDLSVELHNYRYPEPLTQEQIRQKEEDAARLVIPKLRSSGAYWTLLASDSRSRRARPASSLWAKPGTSSMSAANSR
jgi:hypothetical protein